KYFPNASLKRKGVLPDDSTLSLRSAGLSAVPNDDLLAVLHLELVDLHIEVVIHANPRLSFGGESVHLSLREALHHLSIRQEIHGVGGDANRELVRRLARRILLVRCVGLGPVDNLVHVVARAMVDEILTITPRLEIDVALRRIVQIRAANEQAVGLGMHRCFALRE